MKKVIITGSEGFIGRALSQSLTKRGVEVIGIDRMNGQEAKDIAKYMPDDIDAVFHLAAQTSVFNDNLAQIRNDNIDAFMAVVDACAKHPNKPKLVYASSSTAYSPNTTSLYGITKHFAEVFTQIYLPTATGARLHNVYGPNPRQGTLLWYLLNKDCVTLYNNGKNVRHFTFIDEVVEGLIYAYGCNQQLINIANPESSTIERFAYLAKEYGSPVQLKFVKDKRPLDRLEQVVNPNIHLAPIDYMTIEQGLTRSVAETIIAPKPKQ